MAWWLLPVTFMGASLPLWVFLAVSIILALFNPKIFKWAISAFGILLVITLTDVTMVQVFWIGVILLFLYMLRKK